MRHRVRPRLTAFTPTDSVPGSPELQLLDSVRETRFRQVSSSAQFRPPGLEGQGFIRVDGWIAVPHYDLKTEWVGVTVLRLRGSYPAELQKEEESLEAKEASGLQSPAEPQDLSVQGTVSRIIHSRSGANIA